MKSETFTLKPGFLSFLLFFLIITSIFVISFGQESWIEKDRKAKIVQKNNLSYRINLFQTIINQTYSTADKPKGFEGFGKLEMKILNVLLDLEKVRIANESFGIDHGNVYLWHENTKDPEKQKDRHEIQGIHVFDQFYKGMREEYKDVYYLKPGQVSEGFRDPFDSSSTSHYRYYGGGIPPDPEYYFILASYGPNQKADIDITKFDIFKKNAGYPQPLENYLYDPTNGLFSKGDIVLIQYCFGSSDLTTDK